jgi:hypothetical protein
MDRLGLGRHLQPQVAPVLLVRPRIEHERAPRESGVNVAYRCTIFAQKVWRTPIITPVWPMPAPTVPPALTEVAEAPLLLMRPAIA